jgi:hypothetical protein
VIALPEVTLGPDGRHHACAAAGHRRIGQGKCRPTPLWNGHHQYMHHDVIAAIRRFFLESVVVDFVGGVLLGNPGFQLRWLPPPGRYPCGAAVGRQAHWVSLFRPMQATAVAGIRALHGQPS